LSCLGYMVHLVPMKGTTSAIVWYY